MIRNRKKILLDFKKQLIKYKEESFDFSNGVSFNKVMLRDDFETIGKDVRKKVNRKAKRILKRKYK